MNNSGPPPQGEGLFPPTCTVFFCEAYFDKRQIISLVLLALRIILSIVVLVCSFCIPKEFFRVITNAIFIPVLGGNLLQAYIEGATFGNLFQTTPQFYQMFLSWTGDLTGAAFKYIYLNSILMHILSLHCARVAWREDEAILVFPTQMVAALLQVIPLFFCLLSFVPVSGGNFVMRSITVLSQLFYFAIFFVLTGQMGWTSRLLLRELPYDHARSPDLQLRDAKSRTAWLLVFLLAPLASLVPFFIDSLLWIIVSITNNNNDKDPVHNFMYWMETLQETLLSVSPIWLTLLTIVCIPPYRRAFLLIFVCRKVKVQPLPRNEQDMSAMYRYANLEEAMEKV